MESKTLHPPSMQFIQPLKRAQVASLATFYKLRVGRIIWPTMSELERQADLPHHIPRFRALDEDEVGNVGTTRKVPDRSVWLRTERTYRDCIRSRPRLATV